MVLCDAKHILYIEDSNSLFHNEKEKQMIDYEEIIMKTDMAGLLTWGS